jgi:hypothetical protein
MSAAAARFLETQERKRHRREWLRSLMRGAHGARARAISAVVRAPVPPPPKPRRTLAAREAAEEVRVAAGKPTTLRMRLRAALAKRAAQ